MYRVGKKQRRALLDTRGNLIALFERGQEHIAQQVAKLLNEHPDIIINERIEVPIMYAIVSRLLTWVKLFKSKL